MINPKQIKKSPGRTYCSKHPSVLLTCCKICNKLTSDIGSIFSSSILKILSSMYLNFM